MNGIKQYYKATLVRVVDDKTGEPTMVGHPIQYLYQVTESDTQNSFDCPTTGTRGTLRELEQTYIRTKFEFDDTRVSNYATKEIANV